MRQRKPTLFYSLATGLALVSEHAGPAKLEGALDGFLAGASLQHRAAGSPQFSAAVRGVLSVKAGVLTVSKLNNGTKALPLEFEIINTASNVGASAWGSTVVGGGPDDDNGGGGGGVSYDRAEQAVLSALEGSTEGEPVIMSEVRETRGCLRCSPRSSAT